MNRIIHGVSWIPKRSDNFLTWESENISLYKIEKVLKTENADESCPEEGGARSIGTFLTSETKYQYIRCVAPSYHDETIVAAGLANGKVGLSTFDSNSKYNLEFTPRQQRMCLCLAWNDLEPNILAIGHDRNKSDYCITVWDTEKGTPKDSSQLLGLSESAHSLCWDKNRRVLVVGMSQKNIKLFDLRQSNTVCSSLTTRLVHGLSISSNGYHLAGYVDTVIGVWDLRYNEKPMTQIPTLKNITSLSWCPIRSSVITTTQRDSPFIHSTEIHCSELEDGYELYPTKRCLAPFRGKTNRGSTIVGVSWHPEILERALVLSDIGTVIDFNVPPRVVVAWGPQNNLIASLPLEVSSGMSESAGSGSGELLDAQYDALNDDISDLMYRRALTDYGLIPDAKANGELAQNSSLNEVWNTLDNMWRDRMLGMKQILGLNSTSESPVMSRSETQIMQWPEFINSSSTLVAYKSQEREFAQTVCGWLVDPDALLNKFIPELCAEKQYSRAAMICAFHLKIKQAVDILSKGAEQSENSSTLKMAAIALSGFNADHCNSVWKNQRTSPYLQINDPHVRAIFAFLTAENDDFESVLNEKDIKLGDRIAFACKYLNDSKLAEYIKETLQICIQSGDLSGLLLTGESNEGIHLLQCYLDMTDDVQTVSLIVIRFLNRETFSESNTYTVQHWISSYRDLLDAWRLWEKRAELDILVENMRAPPKLSTSVFLICSFCGKSVSTALQDETRLRNTSTNINKLSSCPSCRKPLPRCSLCLLHMGTTTGSSKQEGRKHESLGWQSKPFTKWFAWCQTCRHGGHTEHLLQWFKEHSECPVTSCTCKCFALDLPVPKTPKEPS